MINFSSLKRDVAKVMPFIKKIPFEASGVKTNQLVCAKDCQIVIPARYVDLDLAKLEGQYAICGIFALVVGEYYAVSSCCAMMPIKPSSMQQIDYQDDSYIIFGFDAGSVVCPDTALVKKDVLSYAVFSLFFSAGKVPWFMSYQDLCNVFSTARKHAGVGVGDQPEVIWMLASIIARQNSDITQYYRSGMTKVEDYQNTQVLYTPMSKVSTSATNTFNKLAGNYLNEGIRSALINPSKRKERIEKLLTG